MALLRTYEDIFFTFSNLTGQEGKDFDTALNYCMNNAPSDLAKQFKNDAIENRKTTLNNFLNIYKTQTGKGKNGDDLLKAWKESTPHYIYADLLQRLNKTPQNAPQRAIDKPKEATRARNTPEQKEAPQGPFFASLAKYIEAGIKLIPTKPNQEGNFYQLKKDGELIKIDSLPGLKYWIDHGIERFIFIPKESGLLCFDLDRNHGDGADGVNNFYSWLKDNGLEQIPLFKDLDGGSFPTYTTTASGGLHLYFKCTAELKTFATIAPGVEIKYNGLNITAGGSIKNGKAYSLHGELNKAPIIPAPLLIKLSKVLSKEQTKTKGRARPYGNKYQAKEKRGFTIDQLLDFARQDSTGGPHDIILQMAGRLKRAGYTEADTIAIIEATPEHQGRKNKQDTFTCIKSLFK